MNNIWEEFSRWQQDGYLGYPLGEDAYAYGRASSERQNEDGSSFSRQMERIHLTALRNRLRISFDLLFFDDGFTGFEFEHRPALSKLREEITKQPKARHIVFEDIDRLSRNADWQQGYLLAEFAQRNIQPHFFISPGSQLERYVRGYIAQEGMKKDLDRMKDGVRRKAKDGRVTAKRPRFGYYITDPKDSHYVLHPENSKVVRLIYEKIIYEGKTTKGVARWLNDHQIPTQWKGKVWNASRVCEIIKASVYKGEFIAGRELAKKTGKYTKSGRPAIKIEIRPEEEWIRVAVPAIVTPEEWEQAQECLKKNRTWALRNGSMRGWLLQGLLKCQRCNQYRMQARLKRPNWRDDKEPYRYYVCSSRGMEECRIDGTRCMGPYVRAEQLERKVWERVEQVIYDPSEILTRLEKRGEAQHIPELQRQLDYLEDQLAKRDKDKKKYEAAYEADIYTLEEFSEKMNDLKARVKILEINRAKLQAQMAEHVSVEEQKQVVLAALRQIKKEVELAKTEQRLPAEIPFDLKRKLLTVLVEEILVDAVERKFTILGEIKGVYAIDDDDEATGNHGGSQNTSAHRSQSPTPS